MTSRYGMQALDDGLRPGCGSGFASPRGRFPARVGGHLIAGRFCRTSGSVITPSPGLAGFAGMPWPRGDRIGDARRLQVDGDRLATNARWPSESVAATIPAAPALCLLFLFFVQDITHVDGG